MKRIFLMGAPRSGKILLQSLLAGHSRIHTFSEPSFFVNGIGVKRLPLAYMGIATGKTHWAISRYLKRIGKESLLTMFPKQPLLLRRAVHSYCGILDRMTVETGRDIWVEKSVNSIKYLGFIERYVPDIHFLHIIRDGREVVSEVVDRALNFPDLFGKQKEYIKAIERWNFAVRISRDYIGKKNHSFIIYEELVKKPELVLRKILSDIEIDFEPGMDKITNIQREVVEMQKWQGNLESPKELPSKFEKNFDEDVKREIVKIIRLDVYDEIKRIVLKENSALV